MTKPALDPDEDVETAMDSVKTPRLPELPNVLHTDLSRSVTHLGVRKFVIDTPRDQELKKREQLWQFHKKNRGAMVRLKGLNPVINKSTEEKLDGETEVEKISDSDNEEEKSPREAKKLPKIRSRLKMESRNSNSSNSDKKENGKEPSKDSNVKYTYSSALTIGNNIYSQIRGKEQEFTESGSRPPIDSGRTKRSIVNSIDKLPDLSNALTKLGYMKLTRNVVHFGGGFFGRHQERRYTELRRSVSSIDNSSRPEVVKSDKGQYGSMNHLDTMVETSRIKFETPRTHFKLENRYDKEIQVKRSEDSEKSEDLKTPRPAITESVRKPPSEKREATKTNLIIRSSEKSELPQENKKPKGKESRLEEAKPVRPNSDVSLDIPKDKYGPSSQVREVKSNRSPWGHAYGMNPYRWTNKGAIRDEDKAWVEHAMQNTDVIDHTAYDCFARTKPPKT